MPPRWVPLVLDDLELQVTADFLRDPDGIYWSPYPEEASETLASLGAILPTPRLVDQIEAAARIIGFKAFNRDRQSHATLIASTQASLKSHEGFEGLTAGHGKDIVVGQTRRSHPQRVAIYGARWPAGGRVQPLFPGLRTPATTGHSLRYKDYSHRARGVKILTMYREAPRSIFDCFQDRECILRLNDSSVLLDPEDLTYVVPSRGKR